MLEKLLKPGTEHAHQAALFAYCAIACLHGWQIADEWAEKGDEALKKATWKEGDKLAIPALRWFHAIPNGGSRGDSPGSRKIRGGYLKAEGAKRGVADTFLPLAAGDWHGLYIEMKKPSQKPKKFGSKGGMSAEQIEFKKYVKNAGYCFVTCYDCRHAIIVLQSYIDWQDCYSKITNS